MNAHARAADSRSTYPPHRGAGGPSSGAPRPAAGPATRNVGQPRTALSRSSTSSSRRPRSRYGLLFELLVNTGLRRGEALALEWRSHVKEDDGWLKVRGTLTRENGGLVTTSTKTAKSRREVPITDRTAEILQRLRARQAAERDRAGSRWKESGNDFTSSSGEPCDPRDALLALKVAAEQAGGLSNTGLHTLRHSAASTMLANGVPLKVVSEILGHSSISITGDIYGHVSPDISASVMQVISDALR